MYIIFIPATGFVSDIIVAFSRRRAFGYTALVLSMIATAFIGFGVWVHHMFATPLPRLGQGMFTAASLMIVVPNGVQMFCWLATLWGGKQPRLTLPLLWVLGFFAVFMIGGLTGVMLASVSLDMQAHDTFFVVAHLHYVLIGGAVFPLFGAFYFWFPKWTGRMLNTAAGLVALGTVLRRLQPDVLPDAPARPARHDPPALHLPGRDRLGQPEHAGDDRRVPDGAGRAGVHHQRALEPAARATGGRQPLERRHAGVGDELRRRPATTSCIRPRCRGASRCGRTRPDAPVVTGLNREKRQVLVTTTLDAAPDHRYDLAGESIWPFLLALAVAEALLVGGIFHPMGAVVGAGLATLVLFGWFWTAKAVREQPVRQGTVRCEKHRRGG